MSNLYNNPMFQCWKFQQTQLLLLEYVDIFPFFLAAKAIADEISNKCTSINIENQSTDIYSLLVH